MSDQWDIRALLGGSFEQSVRMVQKVMWADLKTEFERLLDADSDVVWDGEEVRAIFDQAVKNLKGER